jgi:hypothetical protein
VRGSQKRDRLAGVGTIERHTECRTSILLRISIAVGDSRTEREGNKILSQSYDFDMAPILRRHGSLNLDQKFAIMLWMIAVLTGLAYWSTCW